VPTGSCTSGESGLSFNSSGQATATITLYDAQSTSLTVTSNSTVAGKTGSTATFTVAPGAYAQLILSTPSPTAGTAFNETVTATDAWQNPVSTESGSHSVTWTSGAGFPASSPGGTAPTYPTTLTFNTTSGGVANSQATASITLFDAQSGVALQPTVASKTGTSATFTVAAATASSAALIGTFDAYGTSTTSGLNHNSTYTEAIYLTDAYGNDATSASNVTFTLTYTGNNTTWTPKPASVTVTAGTSEATFTGGPTTAITWNGSGHTATLKVASSSPSITVTFTLND
jgi:hypothetical protein